MMHASMRVPMHVLRPALAQGRQMPALRFHGAFEAPSTLESHGK
jgi:hypothetical protein